MCHNARMTQKRRVIYMTDQEWADLGRLAKSRGMTSSALIREVVRVGAEPQMVVSPAPSFAQFRPVPKIKGK